MDFRQTFKQGCIVLNLVGTTKRAIIEELLDLLVEAGRIPNRDSALKAVLEREQRMSTGMQCGVAIPHGKTPDIHGLICAFAIKKDGIDFQALDGQPSRIFVMTLSSPLQATQHIQYLAEISKQLSRASVREQLLAADTRDDVVRIMTE